MPTRTEILSEYKKLKSEEKRTVSEAVKLMLCSCQTCKTIDDTLRVEDVITVKKDEEKSSWNGRTGTIESFEVVQQGIKMWFIGYNGYLCGCTIEKLCPECLKPAHKLKF